MASTNGPGAAERLNSTLHSLNVTPLDEIGKRKSTVEPKHEHDPLARLVHSAVRKSSAQPAPPAPAPAETAAPQGPSMVPIGTGASTRTPVGVNAWFILQGQAAADKQAIAALSEDQRDFLARAYGVDPSEYRKRALERMPQIFEARGRFKEAQQAVADAKAVAERAAAELDELEGAREGHDRARRVLAGRLEQAMREEGGGWGGGLLGKLFGPGEEASGKSQLLREELEELDRVISERFPQMEEEREKLIEGTESSLEHLEAAVVSLQDAYEGLLCDLVEQRHQPAPRANVESWQAMRQRLEALPADEGRSQLLRTIVKEVLPTLMLQRTLVPSKDINIDALTAEFNHFRSNPPMMAQSSNHFRALVAYWRDWGVAEKLFQALELVCQVGDAARVDELPGDEAAGLAKDLSEAIAALPAGAGGVVSRGW